MIFIFVLKFSYLILDNILTVYQKHVKIISASYTNILPHTMSVYYFLVQYQQNGSKSIGACQIPFGMLRSLEDLIFFVYLYYCLPCRFTYLHDTRVLTALCVVNCNSFLTIFSLMPQVLKFPNPLESLMIYKQGGGVVVPRVY